MNALLRSIGFGNRLGARLVIASLIVGSVLSIMTTAIQLGASYSRQLSDATQVLSRIEETMLGSLEQAIWTFNFAQVDIILDGLATDPNIASVSLKTDTGQSWSRSVQAGNGAAQDIVQSFPLVHFFDEGRSESVGVLDVQVSFDAVRARLWAELWTTLLTNLTKAYLAAAALLFLVNQMISRHLQRIAAHVGGENVLERAPLTLDRRPSQKPDDLDRIVEAVTRHQRDTREQMEALATEINERKNAEAEARQALSIRSRFLATMSHEIRTPLNAIMGFLHLIEIFKGIDDKPKLYAQTATKASHQLMGLMNNSLDMSRLEARAVEITLSETDLPSLAKEWLQSAEALCHLRGKDIDIALDLAPDLPDRVLLDAGHVTQIVSNLIDNAIKFTKAGRVCIAVDTDRSPSGAALNIRVCDTGSGIPEGARAHIFERFAQADDGIQRAHGGSGLGLAICLELAHLMGASLILEAPNRDGYATTFLLRLDYVNVVDLRHDVCEQSSVD